MISLRKLLPVAIMILALSSCTTEKEQVFSIPEKETMIVWSGEVSQASEYIGYIEPIESSNVGAKSGGRIMEILAQKWDRVKAGQILARLDGSEAKESLATAGDVLASTEGVFANTSTLFDAQIASMKDRVAQAEQNIALVQASQNGADTGLSDTKSSSEETLKTARMQAEQAQMAADTAQTQYDNTKILLAQKEKDIYLNALNTLHSADVLATNLLDFTDTLYGVSVANQHSNDAFEMYFGARNWATREKGAGLWSKNSALYASWKVKVDALASVNSDTDEGKKQILQVLQESQSFFEGLRDFADVTYSSLESSVPASTFTDATITSYKTQISTFRSNIESSLLSVSGNYVVGIKGSIQNIGNIKNESTLQLSLLEKQIALAKKSNEVALQAYEQAKAGASGKTNEVFTKTQIARSQLEIARSQYNEAVSGLKALQKQKDAQLSSIGVQVATIRGNKDQAGIAVSNATVVAPFDGVIVEKLASAGQVVGSGLPIFQIAKDDQVKVKILVGESEVKGIKVGDTAMLSLAGSSETLSGTVHIIQPFADTLSKKVPVEIWMPNQAHKLLLGSYTNVSFSGSSLYGKTIAYRFVEYAYGKSVLNVMRNGNIEPVSVEITGCNNTLCAFSGAVLEGEKVELP